MYLKQQQQQYYLYLIKIDMKLFTTNVWLQHGWNGNAQNMILAQTCRTMFAMIVQQTKPFNNNNNNNNNNIAQQTKPFTNNWQRYLETGSKLLVVGHKVRISFGSVKPRAPSHLGVLLLPVHGLFKSLRDVDVVSAPLHIDRSIVLVSWNKLLAISDWPTQSAETLHGVDY